MEVFFTTKTTTTTATALLLFVLLLRSRGGLTLAAEQESDRITDLPGQPTNVAFSQYSGYVTVDPRAGRALFYWLVEAPPVAQPAPLVLWLNGGPGCSSIAYGASEELGPFRIRSDGYTLYLNPHAWNNGDPIRIHEVILFQLDLNFCLLWCSQWRICSSWSRRPVLVSPIPILRWICTPLVTGGQLRMHLFFLGIGLRGFRNTSIGNFISPERAMQVITLKNKGVPNPIINFKGFMVGNAVTDDYHDYVGTFEYWWTHGLISDTTYHNLRATCNLQSSQHPSAECVKNLNVASTEQGNIDPYSIYTHPCNDSSALKRNLRGRYPWMSRAYDPCTDRYAKVYYNRPEVQRALHANVTGIHYAWDTCSDIVGNYWADSPRSMLPIYQELIAAGVRIWVFSGDTDAVVPVTATRYSIDALKLPTLLRWYPWYDHGKVGGWSQVYKGLTFVTITGAGHEVPLHRPRQALMLFRHFLKNKPMPS